MTCAMPAPPEASTWYHGTVAWFDAPKGFGFIEPAEGPRGPVFVDFSSIEMSGYRTLVEGQPVRFVRSAGRAEAMAVRPLAETGSAGVAA